MKKLIVIICCIAMCFPIVYAIASPALSEKADEKKFVIVDITMDNYTDYLDIKSTDTAIDIDGNPIDHTCVVVTSKVYADGLYYISAEDASFDITYKGENRSMGYLGATPVGLVVDDASSPDAIAITNIKGKYKFVKKEYVEEYIFKDGIRRVELKDGRYQQITFKGISAVDFSYPY